MHQGEGALGGAKQRRHFKDPEQLHLEDLRRAPHDTVKGVQVSCWSPNSGLTHVQGSWNFVGPHVLMPASPVAFVCIAVTSFLDILVTCLAIKSQLVSCFDKGNIIRKSACTVLGFLCTYMTIIAVQLLEVCDNSGQNREQTISGDAVPHQAEALNCYCAGS